MNHFEQDPLSAVDAKREAQRLTLAPLVLQAAKARRDMGMLAAIQTGGDEGLSLEDIRARSGYPLSKVMKRG